ncbi:MULTISPECIES: NAD-dependent epimerase/dehydratase family protein [unclassified Actinotalea]|uniref:NAD-dependent epimerase/dehydratase family protein n=1 Tax=unclassified Actinotalea TaxID=2638618 RepID=UPI0015F5C5E9|nr:MULTISPECIES: NAD-dependent epimerase/dehydratase family protein [unclassified Actinotalea]
MRVVVVGASGNIGTALLRTLRREEAVDSVVGIARRVPTTTPPAPYDVARWVGTDLAAGPDEPVVAALADAMAGADAVVHLAWAMQPSHRRDVLRATNVDGTARVIEAVARAGVPHLVVASSVGAYAPVHDDVPRTEDWATQEVRSSSYSVDKVAVERLLDEAEVLHPWLRIARVRPGLVFQRRAAAGIERYFLGPAAPAAALRLGRLPVLPWPRGVRMQAVHADDLAQAFRAILLDQQAGAFNVAADDVLGAAEFAQVLGHGRYVEVPVASVRAAVQGAWYAHGVHVSPGWVDLAAGIALMSTQRARTVLGWRPTWTAQEALADLVDGLAHGSGTASPPLRPRSRARRSLLGGQAAER